MADSLLRMVTGVEMRYSKSSPSSWAAAVWAMELGAALDHVDADSRRWRAPSGGGAWPCSAALQLGEPCQTLEAFGHPSRSVPATAWSFTSFHRARRPPPAAQRRILRQFRRRPLHVPRLIQLADERNRPARDQRQPHIGPVLARRVVDDRPAFERRLAALAEDQPVARFPDRRGNHVAGLRSRAPRNRSNRCTRCACPSTATAASAAR